MRTAGVLGLAFLLDEYLGLLVIPPVPNEPVIGVAFSARDGISRPQPCGLPTSTTANQYLAVA